MMEGMVSEALHLVDLGAPSPPDASALTDEAFSRLALRSDLPTLGLSLDELLRRATSEKIAA